MNGSNEGFRITPRLIIGLAIFAFGILWMLDNLNYIDASHFTRWWPIVLVLIGVSKLTDKRTPKFGPIVLIVIGGSLLLSACHQSRTGAEMTDRRPLRRPTSLVHAPSTQAPGCLPATSAVAPDVVGSGLREHAPPGRAGCLVRRL